MKEFDLTGKVALVTGAARGLGTAASWALARAGATVVLTDIHEDAVRERNAEFIAAGMDTSCAQLDVSNETLVAQGGDEILERHGRIDILVNNAGIILRKPMVETSAAEFRNVLNVNLVSMFSMSAAVAPSMIRHRHGRIINLTSIMGHIARAGQSTYVASKHGVVGLTKAIAAEFGPHGITCNAIAPGYFYTEMNQQVLNESAFHDSVVIRTPLRRWADADELGGTVVFLASSASAYMTAQTLVLDAGMTATVLDPGQAAAMQRGSGLDSRFQANPAFPVAGPDGTAAFEPIKYTHGELASQVSAV
jgi:gluconate 5-dehydrogenase